MGATALFLCSDQASQVTGTTISVDGGWTAL
jgi:3-hydroxybutyrate dehydrogenase